MLSKTINLLISTLLLYLLFRNVELTPFLKLLKNVDSFYFTLSVLMFIPTILLPALRWKYILSDFINLSVAESIRLVLAGNTFNMFLPSKAGDLLKAFFVKTDSPSCLLNRKDLLARAMYEKVLDLIGLTVNLWFGFFILPSWNKVTMVIMVFSGIILLVFCVLHFHVKLSKIEKYIQKIKLLLKIYQIFLAVNLYAQQVLKQKKRLGALLVVSIFLWSVHLFQFYCFFLMFSFPVDFLAVLAGMPIAIYIGILPLTIGGIGTRDLAIVYLFESVVGYNACLAIGIMGTIRYLVPASLGSFFVFGYLKSLGWFWRLEK